MHLLVPKLVSELEVSGLYSGTQVENMDLVFFSENNELPDDYWTDWAFYWGITDSAASQLAAFARDASGGQVCQWFHENVGEDPPIVFAGSEGESIVVASSVTEFLFLAASGLSPYELYRGVRHPEPYQTPEIVEMTSWLKERTGTLPPEYPFEAVMAAQKSAPDFGKFVKQNLR